MKKVLIANRGEIALRIIRACGELGIKTVAVHSTADEHSMHVKFADEDVCIGPPSPAESYLDQQRILSAAVITNADAIHPGYGFLAENSEFAEKCEANGIIFIGPTAEMIKKLGDKIFAKDTMKKAGVPTIPGSKDAVHTLDDALAIANEYKYPIIIKAVSGGGGRGMRICRNDADVKANFELARSEARVAFGDENVYMEKFIENPRHVEVQLLGDGEGQVIHLYERDCSVQRRHQKLIEESPCTALSEEQREKLCALAVKGAAFINYRSAGTMEFLLDEDGSFYFMEMNTRIQVEHPVSEMVTGIDLVREQISLAFGAPLSFTQKDVKLNGHAIECRVNAEDPDRGFMPNPGLITHMYMPGGPGVRIDKHVYAGYVIPPNYDSMIAKIICHGIDREHAIMRMIRSLEEIQVGGIKTTIPLHHKIMEDKVFRSGNYTTKYLENADFIK